MGYDGIAYYSRRVDNEVFALCAINLALFVDYDGEYCNWNVRELRRQIKTNLYIRAGINGSFTGVYLRVGRRILF